MSILDLICVDKQPTLSTTVRLLSLVHTLPIVVVVIGVHPRSQAWQGDGKFCRRKEEGRFCLIHQGST